jgi:hypothetical protein
MSTTTASKETDLVVDGRFVGPPGVGNGGYSAGTFARLVNGPAEVTLRRPVPLDQPLSSATSPDGAVVVTGPDGTVAEVRSIGALDRIEPPTRPTLALAAASAEGSPYLGAEHPFPGCFVCGPAHPDGLCMHPGPLGGDPDVCVAVLDPRPSPSVGSGTLDPEIVWAALDCPSFTARHFQMGIPHLLGRLSAELLAPVPADEASVVIGWEISSEGRKLHSASALISPEGELLARAQALWISIEK